MCDQYFCIEDHQQQKFQHDISRPLEFDSESLVSKTSQNGKLYEMEEQLEIAENRCNTLKDQLDQMKKLYQSKADLGSGHRRTSRSPHSSRKFTELKSKATPTRTCKDFSECSGEKNANNKLSTHSYDNRIVHITPSPTGSTTNKTATIKDITLVRQNSQAISTDTSGAAVQTINNILNGITDSVNRLSQLHVKLEYDKPSGARKPKKLKDSACGEDQPEFTPCLESVPDISEDHVQDEVQKSSVASLQSKGNSAKKKTKRKPNLVKSLQRSTISVNITAKKSIKSTAKHVEKKFKIEPVKMVKHDSSSMLAPKMKKQQPKRFRTPSRDKFSRQKIPKICSGDPDKLVEIYHNVAAKDSDSDESGRGDVDKRKSKDGKLKSSSETVPSYPLEENSSDADQRTPHTKPSPQTQQRYFHNMIQGDVGVINYQRQLSPIDENTYTEPNAPRIECCRNFVTKNYELPTIASKMKQVAKSYLRHFNLNAIPFCPAKSTSPSHNIGINIQQVMNIIKTNQPIAGISPTLAHNIELAAEKLHNRSLSAMASTLGSRAGSIRCDRMVCPLNRHSLNYQQLQEMAKEIPEEQDEEEHNEAGASGDTNKIFKWTTDPSKQKNCTCIPQKGLDFQHVYNKYQGSMFSTSTITQPTMRTRFRYSKQPWRMKPKMLAAKPPEKVVLDTKQSSVLKGKEKNLKDVLTNLHNEFAYLNAEYENLSNKITEMGNEADEDVLKQLENMEKCLNNKEEEITMVMTLYKEVVALKQQVKALKNRASIASVALTQHQQQMQMQHAQPPRQQMQQAQQQQQVNRFRDYNDPHAAIHLTKLLRQIQVYQEMNRVGCRC